MSSINQYESIPNNVHLSTDKRLQRALEKWQPSFFAWWREMGPRISGGQHLPPHRDQRGDRRVGALRLRQDAGLPLGIFLTDPEPDRRIGFGDHYGEPVWQTVPGELRTHLKRLIVTQGDTEPASVEQQRLLGQTCPSLYDLRNLFQVNVEEGRHLWAMVYLLHSYFGSDGREEAEALLERRSGNPDKPRILGAFNEPISDWLSFYMFTYFTDRDGKYQLLSLAESSFDPLSRSCKFMLTEEAHHMFVGETGVMRVIQRACELMKQGKDPRKEGAVDLALVQRYLNRWYTVSLDLFGGEESSNAALYFGSGLKGRAYEKQFEDHVALEGSHPVASPTATGTEIKQVPLRNAMNLVLRDAYSDDSLRGVERWNKCIAEFGIDFTLKLPHPAFHRAIGLFAGMPYDPDGRLLSAEEFARRKYEFLPSPEDETYVHSLMHGVYEPGKIANWIAPPTKGIKDKPFEFEYVRREAH
ncbi:MAG: benzoyl-CoA 2,3-epoxidase subunit BoxB [Candidatus Eisenbacteria bacterium]